jgi:MFS family permease
MDQLRAETAESPSDVGGRSVRGKLAEASARFVLPFFFGAHIMLAIDQSIMLITLEPIKREFRLSDTQLGLLSGLGFSLFCALVIVPVGWLVDRTNRKRLLLCAITLFSVMTGAAVATVTFAQLFVTRLLVGAGDAAAKPIMISMLSDLYMPQRRAGALATFYAAQPVGAIVAFVLGGWIAQHFGWRAVFLTCGIPGLLIALAIQVMVKEPVRMTDVGAAASGPPPSFAETLKFVISQPSARHLLLTPAIGILTTSGVAQFTSSLFIRRYHVSVSEAGVLLAFIWGLMGLAGSLGGGWIVNRLTRSDMRWGAWCCAIAYGVAVSGVLLTAFAPSAVWAIVGLSITAMTTMSIYGPAQALMQSLVKPRMRGAASAIYILSSYLVGTGMGPLVVGAFSDAFAPSKGADALRYAIGLMPVFYVWAAIHFLLVARTLRADMARVVEAEG